MARRQALREALGAYAPADVQEREHVGRLRALLDLPGDPFSRAHFTPGHVTASAFVLSPSGDAVLLIHHGKLHRWLQPGGHVDPGDADVLAACRREVEEEAGLSSLTLIDPLFDVDVHGIPPLRQEPAHEHFDVRALFRATHLGAVAGSDARDVRWVTLQEVDDIDSDDSVRRAVSKIRARRV